jgi:hypothetical protein
LKRWCRSGLNNSRQKRQPRQIPQQRAHPARWWVRHYRSPSRGASIMHITSR